MHVKHFEDLEIWKEARCLAKEIYRLTSEPKFSKDFGLRGQIQSAAVSVMSNIAEGFERGGNQEFCQFLYVAKGSCGEVRSQLYIAVDQGYYLSKRVGRTTKCAQALVEHDRQLNQLSEAQRHEGSEIQQLKPFCDFKER